MIVNKLSDFAVDSHVGEAPRNWDDLQSEFGLAGCGDMRKGCRRFSLVSLCFGGLPDRGDLTCSGADNGHSALCGTLSSTWKFNVLEIRGSAAPGGDIDNLWRPRLKLLF